MMKRNNTLLISATIGALMFAGCATPDVAAPFSNANGKGDSKMVTKEVQASTKTSNVLPMDLANAHTVFVPSFVEQGTSLDLPRINSGKLYIDGAPVVTPIGSSVLGFLPNKNGYVVLVSFDPNSLQSRQLNTGNYVVPQGVAMLHQLEVQTQENVPARNAAYFQVSSSGQVVKMLALTSFKDIFVTKYGIYCSFLLDPSNKDSKMSLIGLDADGNAVNGPQNFNGVLPTPSGFIGVLSTIEHVQVGCYGTQRTDYYYNMVHNGDSWTKGEMLTKVNSHFANKTSFEQMPNLNVVDVDMPNYNQSVVTGLGIFSQPDVTACAKYSNIGSNGAWTGIADLTHFVQARTEIGHTGKTDANNGQYSFTLYDTSDIDVSGYEGLLTMGAIKGVDGSHFIYAHRGGSAFGRILEAGLGGTLGLAVYDEKIGGDKHINVFSPMLNHLYSFANTAVFIQTPNNGYVVPLSSDKGLNANSYVVDNQNGSFISSSAMNQFLAQYSIKTPMPIRY